MFGSQCPKKATITRFLSNAGLRLFFKSYHCTEIHIFVFSGLREAVRGNSSSDFNHIGSLQSESIHSQYLDNKFKDYPAGFFWRGLRTLPTTNTCLDKNPSGIPRLIPYGVIIRYMFFFLIWRWSLLKRHGAGGQKIVKYKALSVREAKKGNKP